MRIITATSSEVQPLSAAYKYDPDVTINQLVEETQEGYTLVSNTLVNQPNDVANLKFSSLLLTDFKKLSSLFSLTFPEQQTDLLVTYLQAYDTGRYMQKQNNNTINFVNSLTPQCMFEIVFLDKISAQVRAKTNTGYVYLTQPATLINNFTFTPANSGAVQTFYYFNDGEKIAFFSNISGNFRYVENFNGQLRLGPIGGSIDQQNTWNTKPQASVKSQLLQNWVKYISNGEINNTTPDSNQMVRDLENNYLVFLNHNDITSNTLPVEVLPLKNQYTTQNTSSRDNIYNQENELTQRRYTGFANVEDDIILGYNSSTTQVSLPAGKLTYFRLPFSISPLIRLNVNDSNFVKLGAIAGDVPINADKVFKRRGFDYVNFSTIDEQNGTWLCSWLSAGANKSTWVDRYYNPNAISFTTALTAVGGIIYIDQFTNTVVQNNAINQLVFDIPSQLTFEPQALYAYHHLGNSDFEQLIDGYNSNVVVDSLDTYKSSTGASLLPLTQNGVTSYKFTGTEVGTISARNLNGSFTVTFRLYVDDYSSPFTDTLIDTVGFKLFNQNTTLGVSLTAEEVPFSLTCNLSSFKFGWHQVTFVFDAEAGELNLYLDAQCVDHLSFVGLYSSTPFFTSTQNIGLSSQCTISDFRLYDIALKPFDVRNLVNRNLQVEDLKWNVPTGPRNYLEHIERFFKFTVPGCKANAFDLVIQNTGITAPSARAAFEIQIRNIVERTVPIHLKLNHIVWRD